MRSRDAARSLPPSAVPRMPRTYSEDDARKVFARVAERQRAAGTQAGGLSLEDLEEAARAAGLNPTLVAAAAAEIDAPEPVRSFLGAPVEVGRHRIVRGPVSDEAWEEMVVAARAEFGRTGTAGQVGRTREWTVATGAGNAQATTRLALEPAGADTRIVVTRSARDVVLGFTIAGSVNASMSVLFATLFAFGVDPEMWIPAVLLAVLAVAFLGGTQVGLRAWHRAQSRRTEALLDRLELAVRPPRQAPAEPAVQTAGASDPSGPSPAEARLDMALLSDAADAPPDAPIPRRARS